MFRNPFFTDVFALRDTVDRIVNEAFGGDQYQTVWSRDKNGSRAAQPMPLDVFATEDQVVILAAVPGMSAEHLDLSIHENTVTLGGKVDTLVQPDETKGATWYARELWTGDVRRSVTLPFPIDADAARATFEHGVLRVELPKAQSAKPRRIEISSTETEPAAIEAESHPSGESR